MANRLIEKLAAKVSGIYVLFEFEFGLCLVVCKLFTIGISHVPTMSASCEYFYTAPFLCQDFPFVESKFSFHVVLCFVLLSL